MSVPYIALVVFPESWALDRRAVSLQLPARYVAETAWSKFWKIPSEVIFWSLFNIN